MAAHDDLTMSLAVQLLERSAGRRRRCRGVFVENAGKRGGAWAVCGSCAQAIEDAARQAEIAPPLIRRCLVCRVALSRVLSRI